jgi:hypothetical protein
MLLANEPYWTILSVATALISKLLANFGNSIFMWIGIRLTKYHFHRWSMPILVHPRIKFVDIDYA